MIPCRLIDMETDAKIRDAIQTSVRGTTIPDCPPDITLMNADCIAVMDHGKIVQLGNHRDLIKEDGIYRRIYEAPGVGTGCPDAVIFLKGEKLCDQRAKHTG